MEWVDSNVIRRIVHKLEENTLLLQVTCDSSFHRRLSEPVPLVFCLSLTCLEATSTFLPADARLVEFDMLKLSISPLLASFSRLCLLR